MANCTRMDGGRAKWDEETTKTFLDLCIAEKEKRNYNNRGLTRFGWQNVYRNFRQLTGRAYDTKQMQNKFNTLKRVYKAWKNLKDKSGGGWNNKKNTVSLDPELWDTEIMVNSEADQFKDKALAFEDELAKLFGSMSTDTGTMFCVGGYGERTPSHGSEEDLVRVSEENYGSSDEDVGRSGVGRASRRTGKDHVVDSPPPKKKKSMEYYVQRISESMLERSRNERSSISREQEDVTELLQLLQADGVPKGSELYFIATELFLKPARRAAFRSFDTAEERTGWLRWTWDNMKKKK